MRSTMRPTGARAWRRWMSAFGWVMALLVIGAVPAGAQQGARLAPSDTIWEIRLEAGESYVGKVVGIVGDSVTLETATETHIRFPRSQVTRARPARGSLHGDSFWPEDPNATRLFFSPTGRTLRRGEGYLGVYELFIPFVAYGVTDRITVGGGTPFYLALSGDGAPPFYFTPKVSLVETDAFAASLGAMAVIIPGESYSVGILYGVSTFGSRDNSVSAGLGWGYVDDRLSSRPVLMVGGERRVGRYLKLMTENLLVPGSDDGGMLYSAGVRFFSGRLSADAALGGVTDWEDAPCPFCVPIVNFVYTFGPDR